MRDKEINETFERNGWTVLEEPRVEDGWVVGGVLFKPAGAPTLCQVLAGFKGVTGTTVYSTPIHNVMEVQHENQ